MRETVVAMKESTTCLYMAQIHSMYYTAEDCRSRHQLGESSTASFTFMEQHPFPPAADSAPLCSSAPLSELFFPATWFSGCCFLLWGLGEEQDASSKSRPRK